ncbi:NPCBM/NEW2 domain-containing protein [Clostridium sardiniense]|uniref:NPCBM/NEW2 domain-containing protein n=1 Tax=Clostridium sardiniense TaxID=29369 RepID=A0ABS7KU87_CLOSR|nr:NPCBM/NEW2 domain-containing protein [Clostridium sardiniense]MBY0754142.1 NPCBM/NEW2 domain-containing protein [Clostridium sardiniense]MDQ0459334.1 hypothetical protein [Clostridium sardiniense]
MNKKKVAAIIMAAIITNFSVTAVEVFADELNSNKVIQNISNESNQNKQATKATVNKFNLASSENLEAYNKAFKVDNSKIISITNNGGRYGSSVLNRIIDGDLNTHWETGKPNNSNFKNEVVFELSEKTTLNRIMYKSRPGNKGFAKEFKIYTSSTSRGNDFQLVSYGSSEVTSDLLEIKFNPTEFKRVKFVFEKANADWAAASEIMLYKEDKATDEVNDLFTDETKYKLKDKYKDINIIKNLEEQVANHPLRKTLLNDINIAKDLLHSSDDEEQSTYSLIKISDIAKSKDLAKYNEKYKISTDNFKSVTNNGGSYGSSVLTKLYDGNKDTHWETGRGNDDNFKNEVVFTFKEIQEIERIIMSSRKGQEHKGFPLEYEIYGSLNENSNTYKLISKGKANGVMAEDTEIVFPKTKFKKLKFRFVTAYDYRAGLADMSFYKEDTTTRKVNSVFKDKLHTKISEDYNTIDKLNKLEEEINNHPLKNDHMEIINAAKKIVSKKEVETSQIITLSQRGNENNQRDKRRQVFAGGNLDLTGYYAMPDKAFEVYVDADENGILPQLVMAQVGEVDSSGRHIRSLNAGRNIIKAPSGTTGFAIYFTNKALPEEQTYAPKVRVAGENLKKYPIYIYGKTNIDDYIEQVKNHKGANMTDVMGERFLISGKNSEAKIAYVDRGKSPLDAVNAFKKLISSFDKLAGYDKNDPNPIHRPSKALYHYKGSNAKGLFASNEYIHYEGSTARDIFAGNFSDWGIGHEFGHQIENGDMRLLEVTNNLFSIAAHKSNIGYIGRDFTWNQANIDKYFTFKGTKGFGGFLGDNFKYKLGLFERLLVITQITNYFGDEAYSNASRLIRENPSRYGATGDYQAIITALSEATGYDLSGHFEYYNYPVTDKTKEFTSQFKPFNKKIRYTTLDTYKKIKDKVETFNQETKAVITSVKKDKDGFTINMGTSDNNKGTVAYEIYRDGEFVGFTRTDTYKDVTDSSKEYDYQVVAFDYRVNERKSEVFKTSSIIYKPVLRVDSENILVEKNSEFNPLEHVSALTFDEKSIPNSRIKVTSNADTKTKGKYKVTYEAEDRGYTTSKTVYVTVFEKLDVKKSKYGQVNNLVNYNKEYKIPVVSVSNNGGNYGNSVIGNIIDGKQNTHWETKTPNSSSFKNEIIFDLGESKEISKIAYGARRDAGNKGFATKFEIYVSNKAEGNDFILAGKGEYKGSASDIVEFDMDKTNARRVKFKFIDANANWASMNEIGFYKEDTIAKKISTELFTDKSKSEVEKAYNTLDKLNAFKEEVKGYPAYEFFKGDFDKAEKLIRATFPTLKIAKSESTKVGEPIDLNVGYSAHDNKDGDLTSKVKVTGHVNFNKPGKYTITYKVVDSDGNEVVKTRTVAVVNMKDYKYLTEYNWKSAKTGWSTVKKDKAVSGNALRLTGDNNKEVTYAKGIGAHAPSTIIYDLTDKNYAYFTSYVGVDRAMYGSVGSVKFEVYVDGEKKFDSGLMNSRDHQKYVEVNINDAKELKLVVTDGGNGNGSDHATWGDAKLHFANDNESKEKNLEN